MNNFQRLVKRHPDMWIGSAIFSVALLIRLFLAARIVFPPLDDPAFYIQTARNLVAGRGLVIDVIWNYFVPFNAVTHPSHEIWMPLPSILMAGPIKLLSNSLLAAQRPGSLDCFR